MLAVVDDKNKELVKTYLQILSKKFKGTVHLIYIKDVDYYPAEVLLEVEKAYDTIRDSGLAILNDVAKKAKDLGFDTKVLGVYCGISSERLLSIFKSVNPDMLIDLR